MFFSVTATTINWMSLAFLAAGVILIAIGLGGQTERIGEYLIVSAVTLATVNKKEGK